MRVFIKQVRVSDPNSPFHGQRVSILFEDGVIANIGGETPDEVDRTIDEKNLWISPAWVDVGAQSGEPGYEQRETLHSLSRAARQGGYNHVLIFPNTNPVLDSKADVEYIRKKATQMNINIVPIAAATTSCEGDQITEMIDLHNAGAIAFSDGRNSIQNAATLLKSLEYVKTFGGVIIQRAMLGELKFEGIMHEGKYSLRLGLRGMPPLSETVSVKRELDLLHYADSRLMLHGISSSESLDIIRQYKKEHREGIFASVPVANLLETDQSLKYYEPNFKVLPPLRSEEDRLDLIRGLQDGTLDLIVSNHEPIEKELKELEFQHAPFGMSCLGTTFSIARTATDQKLSVDELIPLFSHNARELFGLPPSTIQEGSSADHTLFQPDRHWTPDRESLGSKSGNNPFVGRELKGKAYATLWNKSIYYTS